MEVAISLPGYTETLTDEMEKHDFLVHSFPLSEDQSIYSPFDYLYNKTLNEYQYKLVIDTNILHFLLRSTQGVNNVKTRAAVGLVAFCQLAEIDIDPALAVYELINHDEHRADEAVEKMLIFDQINNADNQQLVEFSLGHRDLFDLPTIPSRNKNELKSSLIKYRRLREWDSIYLIILAIIDIDQSSTQSKDKLYRVIDWMYREFRLSAIAISFCVVYFGKHPVKNMMKYKSSQSIEERLKCIENMTWDMYIMTRYLRTWIGNKTNDNFLYASDDRAFRKTLRLCIDVQITQGYTPYAPYLSSEVYKNITELQNNGVPENERIYQLDSDPEKYRINLINKFKEKLGLISIK